jgi:Flp pilus assembly protein TadG
MRGTTLKKLQHGVAAVEFALVLPLLVLLSIFTIEFGRAMYQYNILAKSVRDAARYLSVQLPNTHETEARNLIVYGNLAGTGTPLATGLNTSHVPAPTWQDVGADPVITTVTVRVSGYSFVSMWTSVFGLPFGTIPFSNIEASMRSHIT